MNDVTRILSAIEQGDPQAAAELLPLYDELRKLAAQRLAQEKPGQTLQATALVHEAYLRLVGGEQTQDWDGRRHFFAAWTAPSPYGGSRRPAGQTCAGLPADGMAHETRAGGRAAPGRDLVPDGPAAEPGYGVLRLALAQRQRWALGRMVLGGHRQVVLVRPADTTLVLHVLHYPEQPDVAFQIPEETSGEVKALIQDNARRLFDKKASERVKAAHVLTIVPDRSTCHSLVAEPFIDEEGSAWQ
jgi:hypothetical protein